MTGVSRREAIRLAGVGAAAVPLLGAGVAFAQAEGDAAILESVTALEQVSVFAYEAAIAAGVLDPETTRTAELFRDHEQEHADGLGAALEALGGARPAKPADVAVADDQLVDLGLTGRLASMRAQADFLRLAIELETAAIAAYYAAHQKLQDAKLLQTSASIMANEGQHLVVLRQALGAPPVPNAFETGKAGSGR